MIKQQIKPCTGIGKAKGVTGCKTPTLYRTFGLCNNCLHDFLFESDKGKLIFEKRILPKAKAKVATQVKAEQKAKDKKAREKIENWNKKLCTKMQEIARLLDKGLLCPARNIGGQMHGGHVFAKGGNSSMKFNLHNIHRQSAQSNHFQNDDGLLREGIANEYGSEYMVFISELRRTPQLTYKNIDYLHFYKKASEIALKIKKEDLQNRSVNERIELRNRINIELGIYPPEYCEFHSEPKLQKSS